MSSKNYLPSPFFCVSCKKGILDGMIIICAHCEDTLLCPECFSSGVEFGSHKSNHPYQIFIVNNNPIYCLGWSIEDEIRFLDALWKCGLGNWEDISSKIGKRTKEECEEHYRCIYLEAPKFSCPEPLDDPSQETLFGPNSYLGQNSFGLKSMNSLDTTKKKLQRKRKRKRKGPQLSNPKYSPYDTSYPRGKTSFAEHAGWMPKREELEFEWDQDAEKVTNTFGFTDSDVDWELKYEVLKGVDERIKKREEKKEFVIKMNLLYPKSIVEGDKHEKGCQKKKQFQSKFKKFARSLSSREQFDQALDSFFEEFKLKSEISRLMEWRQLGFTTFNEGEQYQNQKKEIFTKARRGKRKSATRSKTLPSSSSSSLKSNSNSNSNSLKGNSKLLKIENIKNKNSNSQNKNANSSLFQFDSQEFLSQAEKNVCKQIGINIFQYLIIKNQFLMGNPPKNLDQKHSSYLQNFFTKNGWL
ncbi:transcriptional adapter 2-alpha [Anaeramoeba flamelloides]|uniref:Transcriptional adapter 2-alpha n=1 Tax=Anaeramoeba flamelloides TaxID=1746091 RepID=A0AAV7ZL88_9EUKA|nr:transcriptional adapter 2-alpha [Anaeramoeba flamelloides]